MPIYKGFTITRDGDDWSVRASVAGEEMEFWRAKNIASARTRIDHALRYKTMMSSDAHDGVLVPRKTSEERDAMSPPDGLIIYNTTEHAFQGYADGNWEDL